MIYKNHLPPVINLSNLLSVHVGDLSSLGGGGELRFEVWAMVLIGLAGGIMVLRNSSETAG